MYFIEKNISTAASSLHNW